MPSRMGVRTSTTPSGSQFMSTFVMQNFRCRVQFSGGPGQPPAMDPRARDKKSRAHYSNRPSRMAS